MRCLEPLYHVLTSRSCLNGLKYEMPGTQELTIAVNYHQSFELLPHLLKLHLWNSGMYICIGIFKHSHIFFIELSK